VKRGWQRKGRGEFASFFFRGDGRPEISPPRSFLKVGAYVQQQHGRLAHLTAKIRHDKTFC